jgi:hypothetical protein
MLRKVLLSVAVLVTLAVAGVSTAEAHGPHHCRGGYGGGYGYGGYGYYPAYRAPYGYGGPGYYGGSGFSYYRGYGGYGRSYSGVGISIGF